MSTYLTTELTLLYSQERWLASDQQVEPWRITVGYEVTHQGAAKVVSIVPLPEFERIGDMSVFATALARALRAKMGLPAASRLVVTKKALKVLGA